MMKRVVPLMALLLAGCAVGPNYEAPRWRDMPAQWLGLSDAVTVAEAPVGNLQWWEAFGDPVLNQLVTQAIERNHDLRIAAARVAEARASRLAANAGLLPVVSGDASFSRGTNNAANSPQTSSLAAFNASWELDVFGGGRRAAEAARASVGAAEASQAFVRVSLLAEVARQYLAVRALQSQAALTVKNLDLQRETERIVDAQANEGVVSTFDLARARAQRATTEAQVPMIEQQRNAAMNALAVLVGSQPGEIAGALATSSATVPVATPRVVVAAPATVLASRPDVRVAERNLATATANQGVALSNWFPRLNLLGLFGLADSSVGGSNEVWSVGGAVTLPLIDFGRVRAMVRTADARQQAALAAYEQSVLAALADVETALGGYVNAQRALVQLREAADNTREAARLADLRYREGLSSLLDVLTAQAQQLQAESQLANGEAAVGQAMANLYAALGGAGDGQGEN